MNDVELDPDVAPASSSRSTPAAGWARPLVEPQPPDDGSDVGDDFLDVLTTEMLVYHRRFDGRRELYRPSLREWVEDGERRAVSGEEYVAAQARRREVTGAWAAWLVEHRLTAVIEPTIPVVAPLRGDGYDRAGTDYALISLTHLWDWTGFPVRCAPVGCRARHRSPGWRVARRRRRLGLGAAVRRHRLAGAPRRARSTDVKGASPHARDGHRMAAVAFDYVIVGAGSAGCVLAARLGEDPDVRVAVIEAGPPDTDPEIHMPFAFGALLKSRVDWDLVTEAEPGLAGRRTYVPRGRVLGGSSSLNAMIYIRGHAADYDGWAAAGLGGWGYEDVLPYFKRAEDNERGESHYHGIGGPLTVSDSRSMHPLVDACIDASLEAGLEPNADHNGATQDGVGRFQVTQRNGRRCSTAVAYLHPAVERGNVEVLTDTVATRILFEGDRAVGVEILRGNEIQELRAEREVIVSCGAYHSPQLLLLSGIGPADELAAFGIAARQDLPVGHNLQDHLVLSMVWLTDEESLLTAMTPENVELFERDGRGPLTSNVGEGGAFLRTRSGLEAPDIQIIFGALMLHEEFLGPLLDHAWGLGPVLLQPESRGRVTLRSPVPHAKPRILHNYLATEDDRRTMIDGVRASLEIASQPALRKVRRADFVAPSSDSDADVLEFVQRHGHTVFHPTGTCAMGTVVGADLKVYGIEGLRVVDASVIPTVPRGNTNAPTIMVAEKASDLIRGLEPLPRAGEDRHETVSAG